MLPKSAQTAMESKSSFPFLATLFSKLHNFHQEATYAHTSFTIKYTGKNVRTLEIKEPDDDQSGKSNFEP